MSIHIPVLLKEVIEYLEPKPNENFIDATLGEGSFALAILERTVPEGKILAIDLDQEILKTAQKNLQQAGLKKRAMLVQGSYSDVAKIAKEEGFQNPKGIVFDLGISSWHLQKSKRGFSFKRNEPLIMRYDYRNSKFDPSTSSGSPRAKSRGEIRNSKILTAQEIVNTWPESEIEKILKEYGEERFAKRIAGEIVKTRKARPILTTLDLVEVIRKAVPKNYEQGRIHPATRTFQALRIEVNQELENLKEGLRGALEILKERGKIVVISYHSLEDRIVKKFFKESQREGRLLILTKKPLRPSQKELNRNPASRSAKLRAGEKE